MFRGKHTIKSIITDARYAKKDKLSDILRELEINIKHRASVNNRDEYGDFPLILALDIVDFDVKFEIVKLLIKNGASINDQNGSGDTPLISAINNIYHDNTRSDVVKLIKFLLDHGANPNIKNFNEISPLHITCNITNPIEIMRLLLQHGANVNEQNYNGDTPLHIITINANNKKCFECMKLLIDYGADLDIKDDSGYVPLDSILDENLRKAVEEYTDVVRDAFGTKHTDDDYY